MSNKNPPEPKTCVVCQELFYGRLDAKTCSSKCRKKKYRLSQKEKEGIDDRS